MGHMGDDLQQNQAAAKTSTQSGAGFRAPTTGQAPDPVTPHDNAGAVEHLEEEAHRLGEELTQLTSETAALQEGESKPASASQTNDVATQAPPTVDSPAADDAPAPGLTKTEFGKAQPTTPPPAPTEKTSSDSGDRLADFRSQVMVESTHREQANEEPLFDPLDPATHHLRGDTAVPPPSTQGEPSTATSAPDTEEAATQDPKKSAANFFDVVEWNARNQEATERLQKGAPANQPTISDPSHQAAASVEQPAAPTPTPALTQLVPTETEAAPLAPVPVESAPTTPVETVTSASDPSAAVNTPQALEPEPPTNTPLKPAATMADVVPKQVSPQAEHAAPDQSEPTEPEAPGRSAASVMLDLHAREPKPISEPAAVPEEPKAEAPAAPVPDLTETHTNELNEPAPATADGQAEVTGSDQAGVEFDVAESFDDALAAAAPQAASENQATEPASAVQAPAPEPTPAVKPQPKPSQEPPAIPVTSPEPVAPVAAPETSAPTPPPEAPATQSQQPAPVAAPAAETTNEAQPLQASASAAISQNQPAPHLKPITPRPAPQKFAPAATEAPAAPPTTTPAGVPPELSQAAASGGVGSAPKEPEQYHSLLGMDAEAQVTQPGQAPVPSTLRPVRTFKDDIERTVSQTNASLVKVLAAEQTKHSQVQAEQSEPTQPTNTSSYLKIALSGLLVGVGVTMVVVAFIMLRPGPTVITVSNLPEYIITEEQIQVDATGKNRRDLMSTLQAQQDVVQLELGSMAHLYLTITEELPDGGSRTTLMSAEKFLDQIESRAPAPLVRTLNDNMMLGVHMFDGNEPFLILKTSFFENAFAGMLAWENDINADLAPLFGPVQVLDGRSTLQQGTTTTLTSELFSQPFVDDIYRNKEVRVLRDGGGNDALVYGFVNNETLVITTNEQTFNSIVTRMTTRRF